MPDGSPPPNRAGAGAAGLGVLALLLTKGKSLLALVSALKFGKILLTAGSMVAMVWFEAMRGGWLFGVGFVLLLFVHEMGHALAIRAAGLHAGYPLFIPGFGAMISLRDQPRSSLQEAEIAIAGPLAGTAGALVCAALWLASGERIWASLAFTGFFLNLFNLVPMPPMDGGRVAMIFSRYIWIVGLVMMVGVFLLTQAPQLLLFGLMGLAHLWRSPPPGPDEALVTPAHRRGMAAWYFGLALFLAAGLWMLQRVLRT